MQIYSIKDLKGDFTAVFCLPNDEYAVRSLPMMAKSNELYARYPEDFALYRVGTFDFESGIIAAESTPVFIANFPKEVVNG